MLLAMLLAMMLVVDGAVDCCYWLLTVGYAVGFAVDC